MFPISQAITGKGKSSIFILILHNNKKTHIRKLMVINGKVLCSGEQYNSLKNNSAVLKDALPAKLAVSPSQIDTLLLEKKGYVPQKIVLLHQCYENVFIVLSPDVVGTQSSKPVSSQIVSFNKYFLEVRTPKKIFLIRTPLKKSIRKTRPGVTVAHREK